MAKGNDPFGWNTGFLDAFAKWAFIGSAVAALVVGGISLLRNDLLIGILGVASSVGSLAGALATDSAMRRRDSQAQFWRDTSITCDPPKEGGF